MERDELAMELTKLAFELSGHPKNGLRELESGTDLDFQLRQISQVSAVFQCFKDQLSNKTAFVPEAVKSKLNS